ncbi:MAG TPA: class F sortase [Acidimicrobiales bacterium]|nr:class F sortase [Acidimicrobiales bacterium]
MPRKGRWLRAAVDTAAAAMIATGALLVGISANQHEHHDQAVKVQAARKARVDREAVLEAQPPRTTTAQPQTHEASQTRHTPTTHPARTSAKVGRGTPAAAQPPEAAQKPADAQQPERRRPRPAAAVLMTASRQAAAGPTRRQPSPARPHPSSVIEGGAVSEVRGGGATLVIPALQLRAPIVATGAVDGSMTIPADIHTVGWYDGIDSTGRTTVSAPTPWPGQPGVSLLAGHVDWAGEGPGALYFIGQLLPGDPIEVIGSNHKATYWRVSEPPITVSKAALPGDLFVNSGPPRLALVTCGGPFDTATRHYLDNVIVWATPAG